MVEGRNEPCLMQHYRYIVASLRGVTVDEVAQAAWNNSMKLFKLDHPRRSQRHRAERRRKRRLDRKAIAEATRADDVAHDKGYNTDKTELLTEDLGPPPREESSPLYERALSLFTRPGEIPEQKSFHISETSTNPI